MGTKWSPTMQVEKNKDVYSPNKIKTNKQKKGTVKERKKGLWAVKCHDFIQGKQNETISNRMRDNQ